MFDQRLPTKTIQTYPRPCNISHTVENQLPQCLPAHDSRLRLDSLSYCQFTRHCFSEKTAPLNCSQQVYNYSSYSIESEFASTSQKTAPVPIKPVTNGYSRRENSTRRRQRKTRGRAASEIRGIRGNKRKKRKKGYDEIGLDRHKSIHPKKQNRIRNS